MAFLNRVPSDAVTQSPLPELTANGYLLYVLRIHRPKVYDLIKAGTVEGFKLGSDWRVRRSSIEKLIGPIPDHFFTGKESQEADLEEQAA